MTEGIRQPGLIIMDSSVFRQIKKKYRNNYSARVIASMMVFACVFLFDIDRSVLYVLVPYNILMVLWILLVEFESPIILVEDLRYVRIALDAVLHTMAILYTGGINSFFFLSSLQLIGFSSLYTTQKYGIFAIVINMIYINAMFILIHLGLLPSVNFLAHNQHIPANLTMTNVILSNIYFAVTASIISTIIYRTYISFVQRTEDLQERNDIIEHDIALARNIQTSLIPARPPVEYLHALYRPLYQVGGDFYDFIRIGDSGRIGILLSDVSGHGVPAAFITSMIKTTVLQAGARVEDPAELLSYMNDVLRNHTAGNFITAFYGVYDHDERRIRYANAGHPQPYLVGDDGVRQLQGGGNTALALFGNSLLARSNRVYRNFDDRIPDGSKLLLYTDGLTESRPVGGDDTLFEQGPLHDILLRLRHLDGGAFIEALYRELVKYRGSDDFEDDICLVCFDA